MQNPIKCMVLKNGKLATYDMDKKYLYVADSGFTVFTSKHSALSARFHSVETDKANGITEAWKAYEVIEA